MFADKYGIETEAVRPVEINDQTVSRVQDVMIVKFKRIGLSTRWIGKILRMDHSTVVKRYRVIPQKVRDYYVNLDMDRLGTT